ncbi:cell envelope integrity protein CreD [Anianabacter salinae]|uniref:cell envelope integrity protein CreD n=1 Tax=Anianabacter salinae TaxID=2851023 RepID=UPI00225E49FA|nr:cell envelope integrity protein CreD [Anianabacter salinae]MBV0913009.1 cell envelope integrity protein CreD [Anianabacter salinae]
MARSSGSRFFIVGLLALLMFIPLFFAGEVIDSRADYSQQAVRDVGRDWGGVQSLAGPYLVLPVEGPVTRQERRETTDPVTGEVRVETVEVTETGRKAPVHVFPDRFEADVTTTTEERRRGIFVVPVYAADITVGTTFDLSDVETQLIEDETIQWDRAYWQLGLGSNRALRGDTVLTADGTPLALEPVPGDSDTGGIFAATGDPRAVDRFDLAMSSNGAESFYVAPVGRTSAVTMVSDWPHPSFSGAFLPDGSEITEDGFTATWTIPHLARNLPQVSRDSYEYAAREAAFGVEFFQPNDFYQKAYRAARYGILFIALTFLTVLLIENRQEKPAHPVQYILIGLSQSTFVLLMVAYAEQIGFGAAYALASGATIALITMFGVLSLKLGRRAWVLCAMLILVYAVLYLILRSADYALLAGSTLAFIAIAATMYATRNEDWYAGAEGKGLFGRKKETPAEGTAG